MGTFASVEPSPLEPEDDDGTTERALEAGWWTGEKVDEVKEAIQALARTSMFQDGHIGRMNDEYLMRFTILLGAADLDPRPEVLAEANSYFDMKAKEQP